MFKVFLFVCTVIALISFTHETNPTIVLPDSKIRGTQRSRFEIHDLTDMTGGRWKAVHIPDKDIQSILQETQSKNGKKMLMDIERDMSSDHKEGQFSKIQSQSNLHNHVHLFEHGMNQSPRTKTESSSVGKIIRFSQSGHPAKEGELLDNRQQNEIQLFGLLKKQAPPKSQTIRQKTSGKPSVIVAKVPEDDDDDNSVILPLRNLPNPIIASLRRTRPRVKTGAIRNNILARIVQAKQLNTTKDTGVNTSTNENQAHDSVGDLGVLEKIKNLILKSSHAPSKVLTKPLSKNASETKNDFLLFNSTTPPVAHHNNLTPITRPDDHQQQGTSRLVDAFSNHALVINQISQPKREALLLGIIKALISRKSANTTTSNLQTPMNQEAALPLNDKQAILEWMQNLAMQKTMVSSDHRTPNDPTMTSKNLADIYEQQREEDLKQELARANEEAFEEKKLRMEENQIVSNYERFSHPEFNANWENIPGTGRSHQSFTPDGQVISMLGSQQLNMLTGYP